MDPFLELAIEDNVAWCSAVCRAQGSDERLSLQTWANLRASPPFYPNIITRKPGSQSAVMVLIAEICARDLPGGWGIKDSFSDLHLEENGFEAVVAGHWFARPARPGSACDRNDWTRAVSAGDLAAWQLAWGAGRRVFADSLLEDPRIGFWYRGPVAAIQAGFITFHSGPSVGVSNWFSVDGNEPVLQEALQIAASVFPTIPIVFWSADDVRCEHDGLLTLAPLRVWISVREPRPLTRAISPAPSP